MLVTSTIAGEGKTSVSMNLANSSLSRENPASGPPIERSSIKCFSIIFAPEVAATTGATRPIV